MFEKLKDDRRRVTLERTQTCDDCGKVLLVGGLARYSDILDRLQCPRCARRFSKHAMAKLIAIHFYGKEKG